MQGFLHQRRHKDRLKLQRLREGLPIAAFREDIVEAVKAFPVVLLAGDTGCGKSTQVPQYLLEAGLGPVVCTQPRRISAIGLARRVAYEWENSEVQPPPPAAAPSVAPPRPRRSGSDVGYAVRFDRSMRADSSLVFMTEGLLLRMMGGGSIGHDGGGDSEERYAKASNAAEAEGSDDGQEGKMSKRSTDITRYQVIVVDEVSD